MKGAPDTGTSYPGKYVSQKTSCKPKDISAPKMPGNKGNSGVASRIGNK